MAGWRVSIAGTTPPPGRMVTLDPSAVDLLRLEYGQDLIRTITTHKLVGRHLSWQEGRTETVDGELLVLDLSYLAAAIEAQLPEDIEFLDDVPVRLEVFGHVFDATGRSAQSLLRSGNRTSWLWLVPWSRSTDRAFLGASEQTGWIFAAPAPDERLFVQLTFPGKHPSKAAGDGATPASKILENSPFADAANLLLQNLPSVVDTTPTFRHPVPDARHLRIGDAAAAADPLAGDGVGRALRGGVLAAATALEAHGAKAGDAHAHYASRIALAHATHLQTCASFYSVSRCAENFVTQIEKMRYHGRVLEAFASRFERSLALNAEPDAPILAEMVS